MTEEMKPLIYAASEGPLSTAQAKLAFDILLKEKLLPRRWVVFDGDESAR